MIQAMEIKPTVREFLTCSLNGELSDDDDMFALSLVSSMFAMQLVEFVEGSFGIEIDSEDLEIDNFRSIEAISALVERKLESSSERTGAAA